MDSGIHKINVLPILYSELTKKNKIQPESRPVSKFKTPFSRAKKGGFTATKKGGNGTPLTPSQTITHSLTPYKFHQTTNKKKGKTPKK